MSQLSNDDWKVTSQTYCELGQMYTLGLYTVRKINIIVGLNA